MLHNQMQRLREKESFCKPPCFALHTVLCIRCVLPEVLKSLTDSGLYSVIVLTTLQKRCSDHGSDELVDFEKKSRKVVWGHWARMQSPQSSVQSDSGQTVSSRLQALHRQRFLQALDPATGGKNPPAYVKLSLKPIWVWKVLGTKDVPCFLGARKKANHLQSMKVLRGDCACSYRKAPRNLRHFASVFGAGFPIHKMQLADVSGKQIEGNGGNIMHTHTCRCLAVARPGEPYVLPGHPEIPHVRRPQWRPVPGKKNWV